MDEILETLSPKLRSPTDNPPSMMVKFNHDKNVLSLAKNTLGSTLVGRAIFLLGPFCNNGVAIDIYVYPFQIIKYVWFLVIYYKKALLYLILAIQYLTVLLVLFTATFFILTLNSPLINGFFTSLFKGEKRINWIWGNRFSKRSWKKKIDDNSPTCISDILINVQLRYKCWHWVHVQTCLFHIFQVHVLYFFASLKQLVHSQAVIRGGTGGNFLLVLNS